MTNTHETTCNQCKSPLKAEYQKVDGKLELWLLYSDNSCECEFVSEELQDLVYNQIFEELRPKVKGLVW